MPLRKSTGNMYPWVTHTWNPIFGKCSHDCGYCYMKIWKQDTLKLNRKEVGSLDLGEGKTIFIGSGTDVFAEDVPYHWIVRVLSRCEKFEDNTYFFQSKNPKRFLDFLFPSQTIYGTTIESNRRYSSNVPGPWTRGAFIKKLKAESVTITIEPIMNFDLNELVELVQMTSPKFVSIGADSKGHGLPEPSYEQVEELIENLKPFTEVRVKHNLDRLKKNKT